MIALYDQKAPPRPQIEPESLKKESQNGVKAQKGDMHLHQEHTCFQQRWNVKMEPKSDAIMLKKHAKLEPTIQAKLASECSNEGPLDLIGLFFRIWLALKFQVQTKMHAGQPSESQCLPRHPWKPKGSKKGSPGTTQGSKVSQKCAKMWPRGTTTS